MKHILTPLSVLLIGACSLTSCMSSDDLLEGTGTVVLQLSCEGLPTVHTRSGVDDGLVLVISRADGRPFSDGRMEIEYPAGTVPARLVLEVGTFNFHVYSDNQDTWQTANNGRGEASYLGMTQVTIGDDEVVYCNYKVPMNNYAVTLTLPDHFSELFSSYNFTLNGDGRIMKIQEGEEAYFDSADGFRYTLSATNVDGKKSSHAARTFSDVTYGKRYNVTYHYGDGVNVEVIAE